MGDYLDEIARFAAETRFDHIPTEAIDATKWILLDTIGGMLAGSTLPDVQRFADLAIARGGGAISTLVGFEHTADPLFAAMVNSTSACSYETDEGNRLGGGHPAIHVLPPSLAAAEARHADGRRLLETIAISYEVMSRLASGSPSRWPVHSHGTHGSPGAAAAVAHLRGLDAASMRHALSLAACMSPATTWKVCFEGGTVRNLFSAESCFLGMLAVDLAGCGYSGAADGPAEMFGQVLGRGSYDTDRVLDGLGREWRVTVNYFKPHASCRITHPAMDAVNRIAARHPIDLDAIEAIEVAGPWITRHMAYAGPSNSLSAKFSIPYCVGTALVLGHSRIDAFEDEALADEAIRRVAARVSVREDTDPIRPVPGSPWARVVVRLRDGTVLREEVLVASGDALNPLDHGFLADKFRSLAGRRYDAASVDAIFEAIMSVELLDDVTALRPLLAGPVGTLTAHTP